MKKTRFIIFTIIVAACLSMLCAACGNPSFAVPANLRVEENTVYWDAVDGANGYVIDIDGTTTDVRLTNYSVATLAPGMHTVRVRTRGNRTMSNSAWSSPVQFEKLYESGMVYTLNGDGLSYSVSSVGTATGDIVIDDTYKDKPVTNISADAFRNANTVTSVAVGNNVKEIGDSAFMGCVFMESLTLPNGLTTIAANAFRNCRRLKSIDLPNSVTYVGDNAFSSCIVADLKINDGIKYIGANAFASVAATTVTLPSSVIFLGNAAFSEMPALKTATIYLDGIAISEQAFHGCAELEKVVIGDKVPTIGASAFADCVKLDDITIGSGVNYVGRSAFSNTACWNNSDNIVIADKWAVGVKNRQELTNGDFRALDIVGIGYSAFSSCTGLSGVTLPNSLKYINPYAFAYCENMSTAGVISNIDSSLLRIDSVAFARCTALRYFNFGNKLEFIGSQAFYQCKEFTGMNVVLPASLRRIGTDAFAETALTASGNAVKTLDNWVVGCDAENITGYVAIPNNVVGIADGAFASAEHLNGVSMGPNVLYLGNSAFSNCVALREVELSENLTEIPDGAFYKCHKLQDVDIPASVTRIGSYAFTECWNMTRANISDRVTEIGDFAFFCCTEMKTLTLGNNVSEIGTYAFAECLSLRTVVLPDSVRVIPDGLFYWSHNLRNVTIGANTTSIGSEAFYLCRSIRQIKLPDSITEIGDHAFYGCDNLQYIDISTRTSRIGDYAFANCSDLSAVVLPDSVTYIGTGAFRSCESLGSIAIGGSVTYIGEHAFYGCNKNFTLYCAASQAYRNWDPYWNSAYKPVVWGNTVDDAERYTVSVTIGENSFSNDYRLNVISAPVRLGYDFVGWATAEGLEEAVYSAETIAEAPAGTTLYSVWSENPIIPDVDDGHYSFTTNPNDLLRPF